MSEPSIVDVLNQYGANIERTNARGWTSVKCPVHGDETASASVSIEYNRFNCHTCGTHGGPNVIVSAMEGVDYKEAAARMDSGNTSGTYARSTVQIVTKEKRVRLTDKQRAVLEVATNRYGAHIDKAGAYLAGRGITREVAAAARLGYVETPAPGHESYRGRLAIPYMTPSGVVDMRFRCIAGHDCKERGCPKYLGLPGGRTRMYNTGALLEYTSIIAITEGEIDALTLHHLVGIPAVGIPGVKAWKDHHYRIVEDIDTVVVFGDGDDAGHDFARTVSYDVPGATPIHMPDGHDINSLFLSQGKDAFARLLADADVSTFAQEELVSA